MRKHIWPILTLACVSVALAAPLPNPVVTETNAAPGALKLLREAEVSAGVFIRFDKIPSEGTVCGLFRVAVDKEGHVHLTIPADRKDLVGDMEYVSKKTVGRKEWHHLAYAFSRQQRRFAFWLDGELQFENNTQWLPTELAFGAPDFTANDSGDVKVKVLRMFDVSLTSDYLRPAGHLQRDAAEAKALAEKAASSANRSLAAWAKALVAKADGLLAANAEEVSERAVFEVRRDAANAAKIADDYAALPKGSTMGGSALAYTVDPTSQEMFLPYQVPRSGKLTGQLRVAAALGEEESGSFVVIPFHKMDNFSLRITDLVAADGTKFPASQIDAKLVKRLYMTGGAWSSYHRDPRLRLLTPCLLVNDDKMFRVDELKCRNYARLDYDEGTVYADISDPDTRVQAFSRNVPLRDAETLQPVELPEAGRNQQFLITFRVTKDIKPGLYKGMIRFYSNPFHTGSDLQVRLRVLPIELPPLPRSYENLDQVYFSNVNGHKHPYAVTHEDRVRAYRELFENLHWHDANHSGGIWSMGERIARMALDIGFVPDYLFESGTAGYRLDDWRTKAPFKGIASTNLTMKDKAFGKALVLRAFRPREEFLRKVAPGGIPMDIFLSESGSYYRIANEQRERAELAHELGHEVFAHGGVRNLQFGSDLQDLNSDAGNPSRERADHWHAAGAAVMSYCYPFPSSENPQMHRRWNGFERYKEFRYDGSMQHGFMTSLYDEFRDDPGGDGNYRNFAVAYPRQNGIIYTLAWDGWREAYDDLRYATKLKQLCEPRLHDPDLAIRGEAKRALGWLDLQNGVNTDLAMLRFGLIDRILTMQKLVKTTQEAK